MDASFKIPANDKHPELLKGSSVNDHNGYVGRQIGNYRLVKEVGSGGFGNVYRAEHVLIDRVVAVKLLLKVRFSSEVELESFIKEARVLETLKHPYILHLLDVGIEEELLYIITDFAAGGSLEGYVQHQPSRALPLATALPILSQTGEAIQFAHEQNIVHRDLKPGNILFNAHNQVLLADFGIATFITERNLKHTTNIVGSPPYMAPELFDGDIRKECDQYALACVAYELLTGRNLFDLPRNASSMVWAKRHMEQQPIPPTQFNPNIPLHIEQALLKALAKQHDDRFPDVKSFISALTTFSSQITSPFIYQSHKTIMPPAKFPSALETVPNSVPQKTIEHWVNEGEVHYKAERYEEALTCLDQALSLDSKSAQNHYLKGKVLVQLGRQQPGRLWEAIAAFDEAIFLQSKFADAYIGKGDIYYYHFGNKKDALESYEHAIRVAPRLASGYYKMGIALEDQTRYTEAVAAYDSAIRFEPRVLEIYFRKAHLFERLHRYEEALATYSEAIQSAPRSTDAYIKKGELFEQLDRHEQALTVWEQIILLEPRSTDAYSRKAKLLERLDRYEEALPVWERIISLEPRSTGAYYRKAIILIRLRRYKQALAILEQIIQIDPQADTAYFMKGKTLEKLAGNELRYEGGPEVLEAFYDRLFPDQHYRDALKAYDQAIHIQPDNSSYSICKGNVLKHLGRIKEAINTYEKGLELEEAERRKGTGESEKGVQPGNPGNRRGLVPGRNARRDNRWFTSNRSLVEKQPVQIYIAMFINPLFILLLLGIFLNSWLASLIILLCVLLLTILFFTFAQRLYARLDATSWLLPAAVAGIIWACLPLLAIPNSLAAVKVILTIASFLVGFVGNASIYLFLEIYVGILDRFAVLTPPSAPSESNKTASPHAP